MTKRSHRPPPSEPGGPAPASAPEPLAVVGLAVRAPGAPGARDYWALIRDGVDAVTDLDDARFQDRAPAEPGPLTRAGLLDDIGDLDAEFFGISPREATSMDPQQRLLLETSWEAFEDAGLVPERLAGSRSGVWIGVSSSQYWEQQLGAGQADIYGISGGGARSTTSGRLSYAFDLRGPSLSVDTACSSSLVALTLAGQSLRSGEVDLALVGGAQLILGPAESALFTSAGMLSPDGRCQFGDERANGFVRGEGVGVVVLKRLSTALADGDPVRAVVTGWGVSSDGAASGSLMAPALEGQRAMLRDAYAMAGVDPSKVAYVEAHGTGTPAGDPIELGALAAELGRGRSPEHPLVVGSVKTNIGHTEPAAGVMGLIKAVLCLEHGILPRSLHGERPTSRLEWDGSLTVSQFDRPLESPDDAPPVVGVSSFGLSGTNAHVVLTRLASPPVPERDAAVAETGAEHVLTLSARSPEALLDLMRTYLAYLGTEAGRGQDLADICATASLRRTQHPFRISAVGTDHESVAEQLRQVLHSGAAPQRAGRRKVAFVFPGQGSQWRGMGRDLLASSPAFRAALHRCDEAVREIAGWSVIDVLQDDGDAALERAEIVQPVLWAMQVALAETWRAWGVEPDVVVGHSMGECAAAYVSGALSLVDSARVICTRARLATEKAGGRGGMAVVELAPETVAEAVAGFGGRLSLAAANGPTSCIVAGEPDALAEFAGAMERQDVFCRTVRVDYASHSAQMDPLLTDLEEALAGLGPREGRIPFCSTVDAQLVDGTGLDASYWVRNLRQQVRFREAVHVVADAGDTVFVEISPHPVLTAAVLGSAGERRPDVVALASTRRQRPERATLLEALGALYAAGGPVDFGGLYGGHRVVPLPAYPWQRRRFWIEGGVPTPALELEGHRLELLLDPGQDPYLVEHRVNGMALVAGPVFLDAARRAAADVLAGPVELEQVSFEETLLMSPQEPVLLRVEVTQVAGRDAVGFEVSSRRPDGATWTVHCVGGARPAAAPPTPAEPLSAVAERCLEHWDAQHFYTRAFAGGIDWGETFLAVDDVWRRDGEVLARLHRPSVLTPPAGSSSQAVLHPAVLEATAATLLAALPEPGAVLADHLDAAVVLDAPATGDLWSHASVATAPDGLRAHIDVLDADGRLVASLDGLRIRQLPRPEGPSMPSPAPATVPAPSPGAVTTALPTAPATVPAPGPAREITLSGDLRVEDTAAGLVLDLRGTLRIGAGTPVAASPAATPPVPAAAPVQFPTTVPPAVPAAPVAAPAAASVPAPTAPPAPPAPTPTAPAPTTPDSPPPADRGNGEVATSARVAALVAAVLRTSGTAIDTERPLQQLGLDSLMALEVKKQLQADLGVSVPTRTLLGGTSVAELAASIDDGSLE